MLRKTKQATEIILLNFNSAAKFDTDYLYKPYRNIFFFAIFKVRCNVHNTEVANPQPCNTLIPINAVDVHVSHIYKFHNKVNRHMFLKLKVSSQCSTVESYY